MLPSITILTRIAASALVFCASPTIDAAKLPYCKDANDIDRYLRDNNFVQDDSITLRNGMVLLRYRFLADFVWMAKLPNGRGCLLPYGRLNQKPAQ